MNLPMYMLLRKQKEYMDYYNKYNNRYRLLQSTDFLFLLGDNGPKYIKYFKEMSIVYKKKYKEMNMIIGSKQ
jgi:hypothetical protein